MLSQSRALPAQSKRIACPTPHSTNQKPAFAESGNITAGNASQISDGGSAIVVVSRTFAESHGVDPLANIISYGQVAGPDTSLLTQPSRAINQSLDAAGMSLSDIDLFEINEAFASQAVMTVEHLNVPREKLNPKGGAIALGHPLGCTGSRQIASLLPELKRTGKKTGICSMCIGTGMGAAAVVEAE